MAGNSFGQAFRITTEQKPDDVAVRNRDDSISITWGEVRDRSDALAGGLAKLGVSKGDTVALMFGNRPEFHICDLAGSGNQAAVGVERAAANIKQAIAEAARSWIRRRFLDHVAQPAQ